MANPNDTPLTNAEAMEASVCIKRLHALAERAAAQAVVDAMPADVLAFGA